MFSCHISFTQVLLRSYAKHYDSIDMYVFLHRTGGSRRIYLWYNSRRAAIIPDFNIYTTTALWACGTISAKRILYFH